jgi:hypothetical protein
MPSAGRTPPPSCRSIWNPVRLSADGREAPGNRLMFDEIGSTVDEVAATLRRHGIKGMPNTVGALNPVVKYAASKLTFDAIMIEVIKGNVLTITYRDWRIEDFPMPHPVIDFLIIFNAGQYPDLILTG